MPFTPAQLRAHRAKLRAKGICTRCHRSAVAPGYKQCSECRETLSAELKKNKAKWRASLDKCNHCGRPPVYPLRYCKFCQAIQRRRLARRRDERREAGLCLKCGRWAPDGYSTCAVCSEGQRLSRAIRRAVR